MILETWLTDNVSGLWFDDMDCDFWEDEEYTVEEFAIKFRETSIEFAEHIYANGVQEPIVIRRDDYMEPRFGLMNGHHRFLLAYILGIETLEAIIVDSFDWRENWEHPYAADGTTRLREVVEEFFDISIDSL